MKCTVETYLPGGSQSNEYAFEVWITANKKYFLNMSLALAKRRGFIIKIG